MWEYFSKLQKSPEAHAYSTRSIRGLILAETEKLPRRMPGELLYRLKPMYSYFFARYSSMALAAVLPAPMAKITVAAPVTASPPA